jgi:DNA ligase 1
MISSDKAYDLFVQVANTSGTTNKRIILRRQDVTDYLLAAYDPFTRYYITNVSQGTGVNEFSELTWTVLEKLSTRELSGLEAQSVVNILTLEMTPKSSKLFHMILNKDLRMGLGAKSINKIFPGLIPTHDIMLAKLFEPKRVKYPCFGSIKIDGVRAVFQNGKFYSRKGLEYVGLNHLAEELFNVKEKLDGELVVPNQSFQVSSGLIRNDSPTPSAQFKIFEVPSIRGPFIERLTLLDDLHLIGPNIHKVPHVALYGEDKVYEFYSDCRKFGHEGAVIKPYDYEYKGTRSYDWMKMKPRDNKDVIVTDMYEGKGKYKGMMGGVVVDFNGTNDIGGGFSDKQRKDFWESPSLIVGKCIEVSYMEYTDDGNFRHANFEGIREDK